MTFVELVLALARRRARGAIVGGRLVVTGPGDLDPSLLVAVEEHRDALTELVRRDPTFLGAPGSSPTTPGQARLLRLGRFDLAGDANATAVFRIEAERPGAFDAGRLVDVLRCLARRHEALRLVFEAAGHDVVQRAVAGMEPEVVLDEAGPGELDAWVGAFARRAFVVDQGPCWRIGLVRTARDVHVLVLTAHHAVIDETSLRIVVADAATAYASPLDPRDAVDALGVAPGFLAAAAEQRAWLRTEEAAALEARALARLQGVRVGSIARARDQVGGDEPGVARLTLDLDAARAGRLRDLGRSHGGRLVTVVTAAAGLAVSTRGEGEPFAIGLTVAGRREVDRATVGMFLGTGLLVIDIDPAAPVDRLLDVVQRQLSAALDEARVPSELLAARAARAVGVATRDLVALQLNWVPGDGGFELPGASVTRLDAPAVTAGAAVTLEGRRRPTGDVRLQLTYDRARWSGAEAADLLGRIDRVLARVPSAGPEPVRRLLRPTAGQRDAIARREVGPPVDRPGSSSRDLTVVHVIDQALRRDPDHVALVTAEREVSAAELLEEVAGAVGRLRGNGVGPETVVDHRIPRGSDAVTTLLATLAAGGTAIVQDPSSPPEVARDRIERAAAALGTPDTTIDAVHPPRPHDAAYVLFTSGSTGEPKGVVVSHANLGAFVAAMQQVHPLGPDDRVLAHTPLWFDVGLGEVLWPLAAGATLVLTPPDADRSARSAAIDGQRVTVVIGVPTVLDAIVGAPPAAPGPGPRLVFSIGEVLDPVLVDRIHRRWPATTVVNLYGPTETTIASTHHVIGRSDPPGPVPIGLPLPAEWAGVLDADGERVAMDVPGDLWLAGAGVARGYLDPAQTESAFVADATVPGGRRYRTGDRARWRLDGTLDLLGRDDAQVKIGGIRTEPTAVEAVLAGHPSIQAAAVVPWDAPTGRRRLRALVVAEEPATFDVSVVRSWARSHLASALVPTRFDVVGSLPTTSSGKLDRVALAAVTGGPPSSVDARARTAEPRTPIEAALVRAVALVLGLDEVHLDDDFVALGGDSLAAVEVAEIAEAEGWPLLPQQLLELADIGSLATAIDGSR